MEKWVFLPNPGREEEGLGHAGIETFKGSPYPGIARESSQNSLDAAARTPDGTASAVHLVFRRLEIPANEIPGIADLRATLKSCLTQATQRNLKKDREFFEKALLIAQQASLPILSVEDYGTTGLVGPAIHGSPFHALVKSSGVSQKAEADAGGSFGIGKNAAFAISRLRTVFYSTLYQDGEKPVHLVQGKSVLVSHESSDGAHNRATGYWGADGFMPVEDVHTLPAWLVRSEVGTTVASVAFNEEQDWHWQLAETLIRNFFSAISRGTVRFTVQWSEEGSLDISTSVLESLFDQPEMKKAAEDSGTSDDLEFSRAMLIALNSERSDVAFSEFKDVGTFRLTLLQHDGFPRRVGILRNGMYIADNLKHFGHAMVRFPMSRDFVAVLEPNDPVTSARVRDMESPRHDEISADRLDDPLERRRVKSGMKKVGEWVRSTIRNATTKPSGPEILLDEMNRFFSNPSQGEKIPDPANKNSDPERTKLTSRSTAPDPPPGSGSKGQSGSSGGTTRNNRSGGKTTGQRPGGNRGAVGGRGGSSIPFSGLRNSKSFDGKMRNITLTPMSSGTARLEVTAVGISNDELLKIFNTDGQNLGITPLIEFKEGVRKTITLEFKEPYHGPISVVLLSDGKSDEN